MKSLLCELILSCTLAVPGAKPVDELAYGTALYEYYQADHAGALLNVMVAEARDQLGAEPVRFELAKGSFAFSEGMYALAEDVFGAVNPGELTELDRMRLAFHLAREHHRRGDWQRLEEDLAQIDLGRNWRGREKFHPEVEYMRAELAVQQGRLTTARELLGRLDPKDPLRAYGLFNLGIAERQAGELAESFATFSELAEQPAYTDEAFDLVQRARLAMSYLLKRDPDLQSTDAARVLDALPGSGRYRDLALAAYGGVAMNQENYELAARIWLTLQNQAYWTSATATARLGFPVSLEKLATRDQALVQYRQAESSFENRLTTLTGLRQQAEDPAWVRALLETFAAPERDETAMGEFMERWRDALGHTDWLEWLATEEVHGLLRDWRTLRNMQGWLAQLPDTLDAFEEVAGERLRRSVQARTLLFDEQLLTRRDGLQAGIEAQRQALTALQARQPEPSADWMRELADAEQRERLTELARMRAVFEQGLEGAQRTRLLQRVERLEGRLFFDLVLTRATRLRALEKALEDSERLLADVDERIGRVREAESQFVAGAQTDFLAFQDRSEQLLAAVDDALVQRETQLAGELRRGMDREVQQVTEYLLVTRIAIARATDQLALQEPPR